SSACSPEAAVAGTLYPALRRRLSISYAMIASSSTMRTFVFVGFVIFVQIVRSYVAKGGSLSPFFLVQSGSMGTREDLTSAPQEQVRRPVLLSWAAATRRGAA